MNLGLPKFDVRFIQLAVSAISRSAKGIVAILIKDDTDKTFGTKTYSPQTIDALIADKAKYTIDNYNAIYDALLGSPSKVIVVRIDVAKTVADGIVLLKGQTFNYVTMISAVPADHTAIAVWVKAENKFRLKRIKAVTYQAVNADSMHVINLISQKSKRELDTGEIDVYKYLGRIAGVFAGLPMTQSGTYFKLGDLDYVTDVEDVNAEIGKGNLVLMNMEGEVFIARAVNTLQTITSGMSDDMKFIAIVETMDLMYEDIMRDFRDNYVGKMKNSAENQMLYLSAINAYFRQLAKEEVLDKNYENKAVVNVSALRAAWESIGKDLTGYTDDAVKKKTFRASLLAAGKVKPLNAIEELDFEIAMQ